MIPQEKNNTSDLAAKIAQTSGGHSAFENAVHDLPIAVCPVFIGKDSRILPATFKETDVTLPCKDHVRTQNAFPKSLAISRNIVLEAIPSNEGDIPTGKRVAVLFSGGPAAGGA
jgi:pyrophosphate--fructose-6-phosphate 1-phosphotransferase